MNHQPRRIGTYDVSILCDGLFEAPLDVLTHADGPAVRDDVVTRWGKPKVSIVVNCFALKGADGITLVDAGTGPSWGAAMGHAPAAMTAAGIAPEQVLRVLITHLHGDHALGLFDGERARFPHAEIVLPEADLAFFGDASNRAGTPKNKQGGFDIAASVNELYAGRIRTVTGEAQPGITLVPLPGHTHGHSGYLIEGDNENLLLWGDALHLSDLQASEPDVGLVYDLDAAAARNSRRTILKRAEQEGWLVSGGHVDGFQRVVRKGQAYALVAA